MLIQCQFRNESRTVEFDQDESVELLKFQVLSIYNGIDDDFIMLDFSGKEIKCLENLLAASYVRSSENVVCATIWIAEMSDLRLGSLCSRVYFGDTEVIQPYNR